MKLSSLPKIDLLLIIIKKLDSSEIITASQLAHDLSVSERTIYRYLDTLQKTGHPIYFDREVKSYRFVDSYKLRRPKSTQDILSALELRKQMLRSSSAGIAAYNTNGDCILVNSALTKMFNANKQQLLAQNYRDLGPWRESGLLNIVEAVIVDKKERSADIKVLSTPGSELWAHIIVTPFTSKGNDYIFVMAYDISNRKQNELTLSAFATAISKGPSLILITDTSGTIEYVSDKITDITGYKSEEVVGKNPNMFKSGFTKDYVYKNMWETITSGLEWTGELCNRRKNGNIYWEHLKISPIFDTNNTIRSFVAIKEDVTQHKQLEDELYRHATTDTLTGLYNRHMLVELANHEFENARRYNNSIAVILIDIEYLKIINSDFSYEAGDKLINTVAKTCRHIVRKSDILGRVGGDEIAIVQTCISEQKIMNCAKRLLDIIRKAQLFYEGKTIPCAVSIGVAMLSDFTDQKNNFEMLLDSAVLAASKAMLKKRNKIVLLSCSTQIK